MSETTARADLLDLLAQWFLTTGKGSREHADRILNKHAHELAEKIRTAAREGYGERRDGTTYYEGDAALWAAAVIDPEMDIMVTGLPQFLQARYSELRERAEATGAPADVSADLDAKLAIVDAYEEAAAWYGAPENQHQPAGEVTGLETALRLLARPFAGHADFNAQAWSS